MCFLSSSELKVNQVVLCWSLVNVNTEPVILCKNNSKSTAYEALFALHLEWNNTFTHEHIHMISLKKVWNVRVCDRESERSWKRLWGQGLIILECTVYWKVSLHSTMSYC